MHHFPQSRENHANGLALISGPVNGIAIALNSAAVVQVQLENTKFLLANNMLPRLPKTSL